FQQFGSLDGLKQKIRTRTISGGEGLAVLQGFAPPWLELTQGLPDGVVEVVIRTRLIQRQQGGFRGFGGTKEARAASGFQSDARIWIFRKCFEQAERVRDAVAPVAK